MARDPSKTEKPTGKRLAEARSKGSVPRSADFSSAILLLVAIFWLRYQGMGMGKAMGEIAHDELGHPLRDLNAAGLHTLALDLGMRVAGIVLPMVLTLMVVGLLISWAQVGNNFTLKPLMPDLTRLNPAKGFQRYASMGPYVELVKGLIKLAVVGGVAYQAIASRYEDFVLAVGADKVTSGTLLASTLWLVAWRTALALLIVGILDLAYQRWNYIDSLKMTKQEIKDEAKQSEGNPQVKMEIKKRMRRMARRRMLQEVPRATVVITNPTHFAVALRYVDGETEVPECLAKGVDRVALKIREIAAEHQVPTIENRPLARTLFKEVEVGEPIPPELYAAVAEILVLVHREAERRKAGRKVA